MNYLANYYWDPASGEVVPYTGAIPSNAYFIDKGDKNVVVSGNNVSFCGDVTPKAVVWKMGKWIVEQAAGAVIQYEITKRIINKEEALKKANEAGQKK